MVEKVTVSALPDAPNPTSRKKQVDEAVGATTFGFNVYEVRPGEQVPWGYHSHPEHEELFYVLSGTLSFDTEEGTLRAAAGDAVFIDAGEMNRAYNDGDEVVRAVATGAPKETDYAEISEACPACGEVGPRASEAEETEAGEVRALYCVACGAEVNRFGAGPDGE